MDLSTVRTARILRYSKGILAVAFAVGLLSPLVLAAEGVGGRDRSVPAATIAELEAANPVRPIPDSPLGLDVSLSEVPVPPDPQKARLGRWLFFDGRLSRDGSTSCSTCHRPELAFSETLPVSTGIDGHHGQRKAMSLINLAFALYPEVYWDGRAASLEVQAKDPVDNPIEMALPHPEAERVIGSIAGYGPFFEQAFGDREVTIDRISVAIASYIRTRISGNSAYDRWKRGGDEGALGDDARQGEKLFFGKALCARCHVGSTFTDSRYHNLGVGWDGEARDFADWGREDFTRDEKDRGAFKTPHLRDVELHPPYMHDGSVATLEDVVKFYDRGGNRNPWISPKLEPLDLSVDESRALVAFLRSLTGEGYLDEKPSAFPE